MYLRIKFQTQKRTEQSLLWSDWSGCTFQSCNLTLNGSGRHDWMVSSSGVPALCLCLSSSTCCQMTKFSLSVSLSSVFWLEVMRSAFGLIPPLPHTHMVSHPLSLSLRWNLSVCRPSHFQIHPWTASILPEPILAFIFMKARPIPALLHAYISDQSYEQQAVWTEMDLHNLYNLK